ncbi:hypothetical protein C8A00DRAFT_18104, partial [Chaetomidium leptoderma]
HSGNEKTRFPGSGEWFLASPEYGDWVSHPGTTLFAPGIPGSGKSVMTSVVINNLRSRLGPDDRVAWFHFNPAWREPNEDMAAASAVIATLALLLYDGTASLPEDIVLLLEEKLEPRPKATTADLSQICRALRAPASRVFLIFDDVDNASEDVRAKLFPQLQGLQRVLGLNIFATALLGAGVNELFSRSISLELRASTDDLSEYLHHSINSNPSLRRLVDGSKIDKLRERMVQRTVNISDGM